MNSSPPARRLLAIGLSSGDPDLVEPWIAQGHLPHLAKIRSQGSYCRLTNNVQVGGQKIDLADGEGIWVTFLTGVSPMTSRYWDSIHFDRQSYRASSDNVHGGYDFNDYPPFYSDPAGQLKTIAFDIPVSRVAEHVPGIQLTGWGGHYPFSIPGSSPPHVYDEINQKFGRNKVLFHDNGVFWDNSYRAWIEQESIAACKLRTDICLDLMQRTDWNFCLTVFGELHSAAHDLMFSVDSTHPLSKMGFATQPGKGNLLAVFQEADRQLGRLLNACPPETDVACFSVQGMRNNSGDLCNFVLLPELMYRFQYPGRRCFPDESRLPLGSHPIYPWGRKQWFAQVWLRHYFPNRWQRWCRWFLRAKHLRTGPADPLICPYDLDHGTDLGWMPALWYQKLWPAMKAFALPSYNDGHIRLNVVNREAQGTVPADQFLNYCDQITQFLQRLTHGRTGEPVVEEVIQVRQHPHDQDEGTQPLADLLVRWKKVPTDVIDSPDVGRVGPLPYARNGGHRPDGFLYLTGPTANQGKTAAAGEVIDLAPTFRSLLGAPVMPHFEGKSLWTRPPCQ